jgi:hypothetical protein
MPSVSSVLDDAVISSSSNKEVTDEMTVSPPSAFELMLASRARSRRPAVPKSDTLAISCDVTRMVPDLRSL